MHKKFLNISEAAQHIGVHRKTLYNWLKNDTFGVEPLEGTKPPKCNVDDLNDWLKERGA